MHLINSHCSHTHNTHTCITSDQCLLQAVHLKHTTRQFIYNCAKNRFYDLLHNFISHTSFVRSYSFQCLFLLFFICIAQSCTRHYRVSIFAVFHVISWMQYCASASTIPRMLCMYDVCIVETAIWCIEAIYTMHDYQQQQQQRKMPENKYVTTHGLSLAVLSHWNSVCACAC